MKLLFTLMLSCFVSGAFADDPVQVVAERLSCKDIAVRVSEVAAIEEPTEEETAELAKLKAEYRRMCVKSGRGRRSSADSRVVIEATPVAEQADVVETVVVDAATEEQPTEPTTTEEVAEVDPMVVLEQELANLDAGLCADGSQPNKFGCCGDEVFKDLGNTVFACCPRDFEGDCFPPLK